MQRENMVTDHFQDADRGQGNDDPGHSPDGSSQDNGDDGDDRVQLDPLPYDIGLQDVAFDELSHAEDNENFYEQPRPWSSST